VRERAAATARSKLPDKPPPGWEPSAEFEKIEGGLRDTHGHLARFAGPGERKEGGGAVEMEDASDEM
ncbi:EREBP-2 protein, partial [Baffinella frigidus]